MSLTRLGCFVILAASLGLQTAIFRPCQAGRVPATRVAYVSPQCEVLGSSARSAMRAQALQIYRFITSLSLVDARRGRVRRPVYAMTEIFTQKAHGKACY